MKQFIIKLNNSTRDNFIAAVDETSALKEFIKKETKNDYRFNADRIISVKETDKIPFSEIVQNGYIRSGRYTVNIPWDYIEDSIGRYEKTYKLNTEPDFQRAHVWNVDQQRNYVEHVMRGGKSGKEILFNAAQWQGSGKVGDMVLVDGLQRLTAVRKFLGNELDVFGGYKYKDFQRLDSNCDLLFTINDLDTEKEVLEWYLQINAGGTPHTAEEINKVKKMLETVK